MSSTLAAPGVTDDESRESGGPRFLGASAACSGAHTRLPAAWGQGGGGGGGGGGGDG
jgi:hypothetical protein